MIEKVLFLKWDINLDLLMEDDIMDNQRLERKEDVRFLILKYEPWLWALYVSLLIIGSILLMSVVYEARLTGF